MGMDKVTGAPEPQPSRTEEETKQEPNKLDQISKKITQEVEKSGNLTWAMHQVKQLEKDYTKKDVAEILKKCINTKKAHYGTGSLRQWASSRMGQLKKAEELLHELDRQALVEEVKDAFANAFPFEQKKLEQVQIESIQTEPNQLSINVPDKRMAEGAYRVLVIKYGHSKVMFPTPDHREMTLLV